MFKVNAQGVANRLSRGSCQEGRYTAGLNRLNRSLVGWLTTREAGSPPARDPPDSRVGHARGWKAGNPPTSEPPCQARGWAFVNVCVRFMCRTGCAGLFACLFGAPLTNPSTTRRWCCCRLSAVSMVGRCVTPLAAVAGTSSSSCSQAATVG